MRFRQLKTTSRTAGPHWSSRWGHRNGRVRFARRSRHPRNMMMTLRAPLGAMTMIGRAMAVLILASAPPSTSVCIDGPTVAASAETKEIGGLCSALCTDARKSEGSARLFGDVPDLRDQPPGMWREFSSEKDLEAAGPYEQARVWLKPQSPSLVRTFSTSP